MKNSIIKLSFLIVIWLVVVFVFLMPQINNNNQQLQSLFARKADIKNIDNNFEKLKIQNIKLEREIKTIEKEYIFDSQSIQLKIQNIAQQNKLTTLLIERNFSDEVNKGYFIATIHYKLTGRYLDFWNFKNSLKQLLIIYQTNTENITSFNTNEILVESFMSVLVKDNQPNSINIGTAGK